jgi:nudix-type nucleoside diphosphatase (YffH/AdpP family)
MAQLTVIGDRTLLAAVQGGASGPAAEARVRFYLQALDLEPQTTNDQDVLDLGPGGPEALALAYVVMRGYGTVPVDVVRRRLGSLRVEAASRVRAGAAPAPTVRSGSGQVQLVSVSPRHAGFFALDALSLRHGRFDGEESPVLVREVFVAGDAVTVLPYDPVRDRVLVVEQFRAGPFGRGDSFPWQIEAIAGRIDPGETPEDAARREAVEEAGLSLGPMEKVAEYYASPGAVTEYLYSYVALCDLPDGSAGVFGAEEEAEDIRGHLLPFAALIEAVATGEVSNAPLILTAFWLQRERDRLRKAAAARNPAGTPG